MKSECRKKLISFNMPIPALDQDFRYIYESIRVSGHKGDYPILSLSSNNSRVCFSSLKLCWTRNLSLKISNKCKQTADLIIYINYACPLCVDSPGLLGLGNTKFCSWNWYWILEWTRTWESLTVNIALLVIRDMFGTRLVKFLEEFWDRLVSKICRPL